MLRKIFYRLPPEEGAYLNTIENLQMIPLSGEMPKEENTLENALLVTDSQTCIDRLREIWDILGNHETAIYPIIGVESSGQLTGCNYVVESVEDLDEEFFDRIYRRVHRLPWTVIETAHCILRETTREDLDRIYEMYEDPDMTAYMDALYREKAEEAEYLREYQDKIYAFYGFGVWSVVEKERGLVIGRAGISMREGFEEPELGFCIDKNFWHHGYALEVCEAILYFMMEEYQVSAFQALVRPGNEASVGLLEHLGFHYREDVMVDGKVHRRFLLVTNKAPRE